MPRKGATSVVSGRSTDAVESPSWWVQGSDEGKNRWPSALFTR